MKLLYSCLQGSCGYGMMDKTKYPYWSVAALSKTNPFYVAGPLGGCGECFEIQCLNSGGQYAVSSSPISMYSPMSQGCCSCAKSKLELLHS